MEGHWRVLLLVPLLTYGCTSPGPRAEDFAALEPIHGLTGVPAEYFPSFDALRAAVDAHEDATARLILERVVTRMEADREAFGDELSADERRGLDSAFALASGFGRILDGRDRISALSLALEVEARGDEQELVLVVRSEWEGPLELRPGPATLREVVIWVSPVGRENRVVRHLALPEFEGLEARPGERVSVSLTHTPFHLPPGALAASWTWSLQLRSGGVVDAQGRYPAMGWGVAGTARTALAAYLPDSPVEPEELAEYLGRQDLTRPAIERAMPPIMERAVRIPVARHEEALELLRPLVERGTPEEIDRMVPALRWLARTSRPGGDPLAWREWMRAHGERAEDPVVSGIDLPRPPRDR